MKNKYETWSGTRQDLIQEIHMLEQKNPRAYKMYSKNTGKFISVNLRRIQQFIDDGLIPPPLKQIKDKQYNQEHLMRYIATVKLKNEGYTLKQIQPIIASFNLEEIKIKILDVKHTKFLNETIEKIDEISLSKKLIKLGRDEGKVLTSQWTKFAVTKWFNAEINSRKMNDLTMDDIDTLTSALKTKLIEVKNV